MAYQDLGDDQKIEQAIKFVALGQPLPLVLETFLKEANLYDLIVLNRTDADAEESLRTK